MDDIIRDQEEVIMQMAQMNATSVFEWRTLMVSQAQWQLPFHRWCLLATPWPSFLALLCQNLRNDALVAPATLFNSTSTQSHDCIRCFSKHFHITMISLKRLIPFTTTWRTTIHPFLFKSHQRIPENFYCKYLNFPRGMLIVRYDTQDSFFTIKQLFSVVLPPQRTLWVPVKTFCPIQYHQLRRLPLLPSFLLVCACLAVPKWCSAPSGYTWLSD